MDSLSLLESSDLPLVADIGTRQVIRCTLARVVFTISVRRPFLYRRAYVSAGI